MKSFSDIFDPHLNGDTGTALKDMTGLLNSTEQGAPAWGEGSMLRHHENSSGKMPAQKAEVLNSNPSTARKKKKKKNEGRKGPGKSFFYLLEFYSQ
jgi:hypothetical protein